MSHVRFGEDFSSVYVYLSKEGHYVCAFCGTFPTPSSMREHLEAHLNRGDVVPAYVFDRLRDEERRIEP